MPEVVEKLIKLGFAVAVETGAGAAANFPDEAYSAAGATTNALQVHDSADAVRFAVTPTGALLRNVTNNVVDVVGHGSPEGVVVGGIGSRYTRMDAGPPWMWVKTNATGSLGWYPVAN